jgi:hypothetical protein
MACWLPLGGCTAVKVVAAPVKVAAKTVIVAGETAGTVVTTSGRVAKAAVRTSGAVTETSLASVEATAKLARMGTVTFADVASGSVVRVPWKEGITLAAAGQMAKVKMAAKAVEVVRGGSVVSSLSVSAARNLLLRSGDVIRLVR